MSPTLVAPADRVARVTPGAPDHISPTAAKSYLSCSLRFYFERVLQLPASLLARLAAHAARSAAIRLARPLHLGNVLGCGIVQHCHRRGYYLPLPAGKAEIDVKMFWLFRYSTSGIPLIMNFDTFRFNAMKMTADRFWILVTMIFSATAITADLHARIWTEAGSGRTVVGEYVTRNGPNVVIKQPGGRTFKIPLSRLSDADQAFIKVQTTNPSTSTASTDSSLANGGPLTKLTPPASAVALPISGEGKGRKSGIEVTNNGARKISGFFLRMFYLKKDGSIGNSILHTKSGFSGEHGNVLAKGKTHTVKTGSVFMKDDTARIEAMVTGVTFDDGTMWPAPPAEPPTRNGDDPVAAMMIGIIGEGERAEPAVACHNHGSRNLKGVYYRMEYLDAKGETLDTTGHGYVGASKPILTPGKSIVISGGDAPPKGAVDARVKMTRVEFSDGSKWEAPE